MKYTTEFDDTFKICTVRVIGKHKRPEDSIKLQHLARDVDAEHGCKRFLIDMREADIIGGIIDTFITGTVPADPDHNQAMHMVALVYSANDYNQQFLETVAVNRGYQLRVFDKINEATEWLNTNR